MDDLYPELHIIEWIGPIIKKYMWEYYNGSFYSIPWGDVFIDLYFKGELMLGFKEKISDKYNFVYRVKGLQKGYEDMPFGRQLDQLNILKQFKATAKTTHIGCKGKATLSTVKKFIKEMKKDKGKNLEYYASWQKDSKFHKDDSVCLYYLEPQD